MTTSQDAALRDVAIASAQADDLASLVRPLLAMLVKMTGLETAYLTFHDRRSNEQLWRFTHNAGSIELPEGGALPWDATLCAMLMERGEHGISDLGESQPDHVAHQMFGVRGYVSVPFSLVGRDGEVAGTLCAGSTASYELDDDTLATFQMFASLIADRLGREIELGRERIRAELAERRLDDRVRFIASAEHSIKSPLTSVVGWVETLRTKWREMGEDAIELAIGSASRGAGRLQELVDDMLGEASAAMLQSELTPVPMPMTVLVELVEGAAAAAADHTVVAGSLDGTALVDARALEQLVGNLVENAVKYSPAGTTVTVESAVVPDEDRVRILVLDEGPGVPEGHDLFAPFNRGVQTQIKGTGIGLHIVNTLAQASGGSVTAANRPSGGACFTIELPVAPEIT